MNKLLFKISFFCVLLVSISSCRVFHPNRMFKTESNIRVDSIQREIKNAEKNYTIQKNDYLSLKVYTNAGEILIDPDNQLSKTQGGVQAQSEPSKYLIRDDGKVKLPMIGDVNVVGLTLFQADSLLSIEYSKYYQGAYAVTKLLNKRVVVLGPTGGKIIPLENENINLIEVIALYGGISDIGKAYNIRLVRGNLDNPDVSVIDLSTIEGMKKANMDIQPNDIVYIETQKRLLSETIREITPLISLITSITAIIIILTRK